MNFREITVCLDMYGCPNRCRHCWLGASPNGNMPVSEIEDTAKAFRPFTDSLEIADWYREPDFRDNYKELRELCAKMSDRQTEHFELVSFWRLVRDDKYAEWLAELGLKAAQLTIFGSEDITDRYIGRKGAYREILRAMDILIKKGIAPRIQMFVNKQNISELPYVEEMIKNLQLEERCRAFGGSFSFFLHQGSCAGENEKLYDDWVTPEDIRKIPPLLEEYTLRHFGESSLMDVFGQTECSLFEELGACGDTSSYVAENPVFYIDRDFQVYPNISAPAPHWCLGSLKADGAESVLTNYAKSRSMAQHIRLTVPVGEIVRACGNRESRRLFGKSDYIELMLNRYCREKAQGNHKK